MNSVVFFENTYIVKSQLDIKTIQKLLHEDSRIRLEVSGHYLYDEEDCEEIETSLQPILHHVVDLYINLNYITPRLFDYCIHLEKLCVVLSDYVYLPTLPRLRYLVVRDVDDLFIEIQPSLEKITCLRTVINGDKVVGPQVSEYVQEKWTGTIESLQPKVEKCFPNAKVSVTS